MKITIEHTSDQVSVQGVRCRVWQGMTEGGVDCLVFVPLVTVARDADNSEFERVLREVPQQIKPVSEYLGTRPATRAEIDERMNREPSQVRDGRDPF